MREFEIAGLGVDHGRRGMPKSVEPEDLFVRGICSRSSIEQSTSFVRERGQLDALLPDPTSDTLREFIGQND